MNGGSPDLVPGPICGQATGTSQGSSEATAEDAGRQTLRMRWQAAAPLTVSYVPDTPNAPSLADGNRVSAWEEGDQIPIVVARLFGDTAMAKRKELYLIPGGKFGGTDVPSDPPLSESCDQLLRKAHHYRNRAIGKCHNELSSLIDDMIDGIKALEVMELSAEAESRPRAIEYRCLIAELEIEIVAALEES